VCIGRPGRRGRARRSDRLFLNFVAVRLIGDVCTIRQRNLSLHPLVIVRVGLAFHRVAVRGGARSTALLHNLVGLREPRRQSRRRLLCRRPPRRDGLNRPTGWPCYVWTRSGWPCDNRWLVIILYRRQHRRQCRCRCTAATWCSVRASASSRFCDALHIEIDDQPNTTDKEEGDERTAFGILLPSIHATHRPC
jgi:hypothetical protein